MELFRSALEPKRYVALKMDYPGKNNILLIGDEKGLYTQDVTGCTRYRDGGTTILTTANGYCFTRASPIRKGMQHVLAMPDGSQHAMIEAADDDPMWKLVPSSEPRMEKSPATKDWTEVDDSILRGWKKDTVLLCEVFPKRSIDEIKERISFLKQ